MGVKSNLIDYVNFVIFFFSNDESGNLVSKSNHKNTKKEQHSQNEKSAEEPIDLTCISYVKSSKFFKALFIQSV